MAKLKKADFKPARDWINALPPDRREQVEIGAAEIVRTVHLSELRKALRVTQATMADKAGMKQAEISRIENNPDSVQLRTMERYVRALGGRFRIVADFPDGTHAEIPLHSGKLVKSRLSVSRPHNEEGKGQA